MNVMEHVKNPIQFTIVLKSVCRPLLFVMKPKYDEERECYKVSKIRQPLKKNVNTRDRPILSLNVKDDDYYTF